MSFEYQTNPSVKKSAHHRSLGIVDSSDELSWEELKYMQFLMECKRFQRICLFDLRYSFKKKIEVIFNRCIIMTLTKWV